MPHAVMGFRLLTALRLQKLMARALIARGWRVTFFFFDEGQQGVVERARQDIDGLAPLRCLDEFPDSGVSKLRIWGVHPSPLRVAAAKAFFWWTKDPGIAAHRALHQRMIARAQAALRQLAPSAIVINEDGITSNFQLLAAARDFGIPIVDLPFAYLPGFIFEVDMENKKNSGDLLIATGREKRALRAIAPQWLKTGRFADAVMFPPPFILAAESLGITVKDSWTRMGGFANVLCAEGEELKQRYLSEGVPAAKIKMTGSPYADEILDSLALDEQARAAFRKPRWIDQSRPRILITWSLNRHPERGAFSEFPTYRDMTLAFFRRLRKLSGVTVTTLLSPNCPQEAQSWIESEGFPVSSEYIITLIARHDLLVAASSSTRLWAFASGKPVVSYDTYRMEHHQLDAPGFITSPRLDDVMSTIERLTTSPDAYREAAGPQCEVAERWAIMDGQCSDRIVDVMTQLAEKRRPRRPYATPARS